MELLNELQTLLAVRPWLLFLSIAILPGLGFPASILFTLAGVAWGTSPISCIWVILALTINLSWTYWLARSPAGSWVRSWIPERWLTFIDGGNVTGVRTILILRLTPGMPLFIQNYVLGVLKVPFHVYLPLSLLLSSLWACAFVISGGAIFRGNMGHTITGVSLLMIAILVTKMCRRYARDQSKGF